MLCINELPGYESALEQFEQEGNIIRQTIICW